MKFWQELRRRRVYRMAGLYIVGAWVVIQVAEVSFEAWGIPDSALRYLFIAAVLCFPIAAILSWYYDVTAKGIIRTEPAEATDEIELKLQRADYGVLAALLAVGLAILLGSVGRIQQEIESAPVTEPETATARRENSIAVLPFTNLDPNPDTGYFSDGVTEEILSRLSTLGKLHVLGKISPFAFRNSEEGPASISEKLGVRYLLQGSVRRDNDYVRITANLLDEQGFQLWSQSYDRKLESIFIIQAEIASLVSGHIVNEIVPMQQLPVGRTTSNTEAYTAYLLGKSLFDARGEDWVTKAAVAFSNAMELDPGYAPPYAGLAIVTCISRPNNKMMKDCLALAEESLQLDPDLPIGHAALGFMQSGLGDPQRGAVSLPAGNMSTWTCGAHTLHISMAITTRRSLTWILESTRVCATRLFLEIPLTSSLRTTRVTLQPRRNSMQFWPKSTKKYYNSSVSITPCRTTGGQCRKRVKGWKGCSVNYLSGLGMNSVQSGKVA